MSLDSLFSPISVGSLTLENRVVMPAMETPHALTLNEMQELIQTFTDAAERVK